MSMIRFICSLLVKVGDRLDPLVGPLFARNLNTFDEFLCSSA